MTPGQDRAGRRRMRAGRQDITRTPEARAQARARRQALQLAAREAHGWRDALARADRALGAVAS